MTLHNRNVERFNADCLPCCLPGLTAVRAREVSASTPHHNVRAPRHRRICRGGSIGASLGSSRWCSGCARVARRVARRVPGASRRGSRRWRWRWRSRSRRSRARTRSRSPRGVGADPLIDDGGVEAHDPLDPLEARCRADAASLGSFDAATDPAACASSAVGASEDGAPPSRPSARARRPRARRRAPSFCATGTSCASATTATRASTEPRSSASSARPRTRESSGTAPPPTTRAAGGVEPGTGRSPPDAALPPGVGRGWSGEIRRPRCPRISRSSSSRVPPRTSRRERVSPRDSGRLGGAAVGAASAALAALLAGVAGVKDVRREQKFFSLAARGTRRRRREGGTEEAAEVYSRRRSRRRTAGSGAPGPGACARSRRSAPSRGVAR